MLLGEAGVGKSALMAAAADAPGMRILRTRGIESESPLAFAALHRLLLPVLERADRLPAPQRKALLAAFGSFDGLEGSNDRFTVFLAALTLLAGAAHEGPVLCLVDDAHWLDDASAAALAFVARRLESESVAILFAARDEGSRNFDSTDIPTVRVRGLGSEAAAELLNKSGTPVAVDVCRELVQRTSGNPLALIELPTALTEHQLMGRAPLPAHLPLTDGVERVFLDRSRTLSPGAQKFLLLTAVDDTGDYHVLRRAAEWLQLENSVEEELEDAGLMRVRGFDVELRHPLVRSAIYGSATNRDVRDAHRALARAMPGGQYLERRVWHMAAAIAGADEDVAHELDLIAERSSRNGGHEAASAAWERAADVSADDQERPRRLFMAAHSAWIAGQPNRSRNLAQLARGTATDEGLAGEIDLLRARIEWNHGSPQVGHGIVMSTAERLARVDPSRATDIAVIAAALATFGNDSGVNVDLASLIPAALPDDSPHRRCSSYLLQGLLNIVGGNLGAAASVLQEAFAAAPGVEDPDLLFNLAIGALHVGADDTALGIHSRILAQARQNSELARVLHALALRSFTEIATGRWQEARAGLSEVLTVAEATNQRMLLGYPTAALRVLDLLRDGGQEPSKDPLTVDTPTTAHGGVMDPIEADFRRWARALRLTLDDPAAAAQELGSITHPFVSHATAIDRIELALRLELPAEAVRVTTGLETFAEATRQPWARALAAHARAVADPAQAETHFTAALLHHQNCPRAFNRGRTELAFGEFLRRNRQRVRAREHLGRALQIFRDLDAGPWVERARDELRASGQSVQKRDQETIAALTPQELQVALLVQQGLANKEVASRLFVSPRTVDFHLRNVFTKLGISSRAALTGIDLTRLAAAS